MNFTFKKYGYTCKSIFAEQLDRFQARFHFIDPSFSILSSVMLKNRLDFEVLKLYTSLQKQNSSVQLLFEKRFKYVYDYIGSKNRSAYKQKPNLFIWGSQHVCVRYCADIVASETK